MSHRGGLALVPDAGMWSDPGLFQEHVSQWTVENAVADADIATVELWNVMGTMHSRVYATILG